LNWFNIETKTLRSPEILAAPPAALGTWIRVTSYCCEVENGGVIRGAVNWNDRQWMTACGVTVDEVKEAAVLLKTKHDDIVVSLYPGDKEKEVQENRKRASENGKLGGRPKKITQTKPSGFSEKTQPVSKNNPEVSSGFPKNNPEQQSGFVENNPDETQPFVGQKAEKEIEEEKEGELEQEVEQEPEEEPEPEGAGNHFAADEQPWGLSSEGDFDSQRQESNPLKLRLFALFNRRITRLMAPKEDKAFRQAHITNDDLTSVEEYYADSHPEWDGKDYRRRDLQTLLNNWSAEVDKAESWKAFSKQPAKEKPVFSKTI